MTESPPATAPTAARDGTTTARDDEEGANEMADEMSDTPVLDLLALMNAASVEASSLDAETLMLVRIAALVAVDAPPFSYMANLGIAEELDIDPDQVRGVLTAVAPIVGTAKVASATGKIVSALALAIETAELAELEEELEELEAEDGGDGDDEDGS